MSANLFAPPTPEELAAFAPPTSEELDGVPTGGRRGGGRPDPTAHRQAQQKLSDSFLAPAMGQANAAAGVLDVAANSVINAPADVLNSAANLAATAAGRTGNALGFENNFEATARDPANSFGRVPLLSQQGRDVAQGMGEAMPDWVRNMDPAILDLLNVAGAKGITGNIARPGEALLPRISTPKEVSAIRNAGAIAPVAKAAGFDVTPSTVAGSRSVAPSGGAAFMENRARNPEASLRNVPQANRRLGDELNVQVDADGRLEPAAFDDARQPAFQVYDEGRTFAGGPNQTYTDAVTRALQSVDVPADAEQEVARLAQKYSQVGDSATLIENLKQLRRSAGKRREGDTANQVANEAIADVQMAVADELENELGRRAASSGDHGYQQRLRDNRLHLAQLYEAERATRGGFVDVTDLAARQSKHGKLTGELQLLATLGENMPDVFEHPQGAVQALTSGPPEAASKGGLLFRGAERLGVGALSRRSMRGFNEKIPFGPNALDSFNISPVRYRGRASPMGPNSGPMPDVPPPQAPPGLFADTIPGPVTPSTPSAGRPPPSGPSFNQLLAGDMAGDLTLEGQTPRGPAPSAPQSRPMDTVDFARELGPDAPDSRALPALTQDALRLAPDRPLSLVDQPPVSFAAALDEPVSLRGKEPLGRGIQSSYADQLGPTQDPLTVPEGPGMPDNPRGVSGPKSAQLSDPKLPKGFNLLDDDTPPPLGPQFGPKDEFPAPAGGAPSVSSLPPIRPDEGARLDALLASVPDDALPRAAPGSESELIFEDVRLLRELGLDTRLAKDQDFMATVLAEVYGDGPGRRPIPAAPAGDDFASSLSLAEDSGPPRSRVDVTEDAPSQGSKLWPHDYKLPKATRIETPEGYIDYLDQGDTWQIKHTKTAPGLEGKGLGQARELDMARRAEEAGVTLNHDNEMNADARRMFEALRKKGAITAEGPFDDGGPVYRDIRLGF